MGIPIGTDYRSTMSATVTKHVTCENCSCSYTYEMTRSATGQGTSVLWLDNEGAESRAQERAAKSLERQLRTGCDLVPCPDCGWVQRDMAPRVRARHLIVLFLVNPRRAGGGRRGGDGGRP